MWPPSLRTALFALLSIAAATPIATWTTSDDGSHSTTTAAVHSLLEHLYEEEAFTTILLQRFSKTALSGCPVVDLERGFRVPWLALPPHHKHTLHKHYNDESLTIGCLDPANAVNELRSLADKLDGMRQRRVLLLIAADNTSAGIDEPPPLVATVLHEAMRLRFVNVAVLLGDFAQTRIYHTFRHHPSFAMQRMSLPISSTTPGSTSVLPFFVDQFADMHGKTVLTLVDHIEPRTVLFDDANGLQTMGGYVGHFLNTFAEHHNCRFDFPIEIPNDRVIYIVDIRASVQNGSIEVGGSIIPTSAINTGVAITYPMEFSQWRVMTPIEEPLSPRRLLILVLHHSFVAVIIVQCIVLSLILTSAHRFRPGRGHGRARRLLLDYVWHEAVMRGFLLNQPFHVLGRPRRLVRFLYVIIWLGGFFVGTSFSANLANLLTAPPAPQTVDTIEDLIRNPNLPRILFADEERGAMSTLVGKDYLERNAAAFMFVSEFRDMQVLRRNLDTRYAYPVTTSLWKIIEHQQRYFQQRIFRLPADLIFAPVVLFSLPTVENSIYLDPMNQFNQRVQANGMFKYWYDCAFYELLRLGRISLTDRSRARVQQPLAAGDFYWLWLFYGAAIASAGIIFGVELLEGRFGRQWSVLRRWAMWGGGVP